MTRLDEAAWLAERFEENRTRLRAVAYRVLGSPSEADDAVQEAWLRVSGTDPSGVDNFGGWLTTIVARVCLDMLRSRTSRREESLSAHLAEQITNGENLADPEDEAVLADSVGPALLVVLDRLTPAERLAFVLHDMFEVPFEEIAPIVGRSPAAARQLASRARRRVRGAKAPHADLGRQREVVEAFLAAARGGDFDGLLALLDPEVVLRTDRTAVRGGAREASGALAVARAFAWPKPPQGARAARLALVHGAAAIALAPGGRVRLVLKFELVGGRIARIDQIADPDRLDRMDLRILNG
jgi:RNA polymerase sigma factor (sigma-70 family)